MTACKQFWLVFKIWNAINGNGNYVNRVIPSSKLIFGGFFTFETTSVRRSQDSGSDRKICFGILVYFGRNELPMTGNCHCVNFLEFCVNFSEFIETIMCGNDELSSPMNWVWLFTKRFRFFCLICRKYVAKSFLKYLAFPFSQCSSVLNLLVNNQLNSSSNSTQYCGTQFSHLIHEVRSYA